MGAESLVYLCPRCGRPTELLLVFWDHQPPYALTFPPPGWCFRFSVEPILDLTFFRSGMGTGAVCRRLLAEDGDLGGVRTTATFLGSRVGGVGRDGVRERLPGVPGEPGLL